MSTEPDIHPAGLESSPFDGAENEASIAVEAARARPHVERVEPVAMADVIRAAFQMRGEYDPTKDAHPFGGMCKACALKEPPVETRLDVLWRQINPVLAPGWFAVNCCDSCYEEAKIDSARLKANREFWERVCPIEFRKDWDARRGDPKLLSKVMSFQMSLKRGMMIHGPSDSGKTRAVWHLLRKLSEEGVSWCFIESIDLIDEIPKEAFNCQLLIIDDLGNDHLTGQKEVRFLKLIRTRCNWHRPFIITTQFNGDSLRKKFSEGATAAAIIRRLRDYCDAIEARTKI